MIHLSLQYQVRHVSPRAGMSLWYLLSAVKKSREKSREESREESGEKKSGKKSGKKVEKKNQARLKKLRKKWRKKNQAWILHGTNWALYILFCRELLVTEPYVHKVRSIERAKAWEQIASNLNSIQAPKFRVTTRSVHDCYTHLTTRKAD